LGRRNISIETFELERLAQGVFDEVYKELGYQNIQRVVGKANRYFDLTLAMNGVTKKIEEKALQYYHQDCPIELIQNIWPLSQGWLYETTADYLHFLYYQDKRPHVLYQVNKERLVGKLDRAGFFEINERKANKYKIQPRLSEINFGITVNLCINWKYLIEKNCARILKSWIEQKSFYHERQSNLFDKELSRALGHGS
jgi:hypothetical protein